LIRSLKTHIATPPMIEYRLGLARTTMRMMPGKAALTLHL
ncbi:unnamed protein product, partial [marine sediment metagenome]